MGALRDSCWPLWRDGWKGTGREGNGKGREGVEGNGMEWLRGRALPVCSWTGHCSKPKGVVQNSLDYSGSSWKALQYSPHYHETYEYQLANHQSQLNHRGICGHPHVLGGGPGVLGYQPLEPPNQPPDLDQSLEFSECRLSLRSRW